MSDTDKYTPNMEKLKADLGRVPPSMVVQGKPEDFAPKRYGPPKDVSPNYEPELSQSIKALMRDCVHWEQLTWGEREALDEIASKMAAICVGKDYWEEIATFAVIGQTANRNHET